MRFFFLILITLAFGYTDGESILTKAMDSTRRYSNACIATHIIGVYKRMILGIDKTIHVGLVLLD
jgi:hypothetical protein